MSMSNSSDAGRAVRQEARGRERTVTLIAAEPKAGGDDVWRGEQQAVGTRAMTVGDDHHFGLIFNGAKQLR